jgi:hypothetical protein
MKKIILILALLYCMLPAEVPAGTAQEPGPNIAAGNEQNAPVKKKPSGKKQAGTGKAEKKPAAAQQAAQGTQAGKEPGTKAAAPAPAAPANGSTLEHGFVGFTWTRSSGTPTYQLQVAKDPGFASPVINVATQAASYITGAELASGTYYWRVQEANARKQGKPWSPAWKFTVPVSAPLNTMASNFINDGMMSTNTTTVSLALSATSGNGIAAYAIAETTAASETGEPRWVAVTPAKQYASVVPYALSSGEGMKTLTVWFKDTAGKISAKKSDTITIDATPPDTTITSHPDDAVDSTAASFGFRSSEPGSKFRCSLDEGAFDACSSPASYAGLAKGSHRFSVRAIDAAGNIDPTPAQYAWTVNLPVRNTTPPKFINRGATVTYLDTVHLSLSAYAVHKENLSGFYVSERPNVPAASDEGWIKFRETRVFSREIDYTMSRGTGNKVLYVWFRDSEGNVSDVQSDTINRIETKYVVLLFLFAQLLIIL